MIETVICMLGVVCVLASLSERRPRPVWEDEGYAPPVTIRPRKPSDGLLGPYPQD